MQALRHRGFREAPACARVARVVGVPVASAALRRAQSRASLSARLTLLGAEIPPWAGPAMASAGGDWKGHRGPWVPCEVSGGATGATALRPLPLPGSAALTSPLQGLPLNVFPVLVSKAAHNAVPPIG